MKNRLIYILCALMSAFCLTVGGLAAETFPTMMDLYQHWSMEQMPDWVCSVVSADGSSERLAVVVSSQEAADELTEMIEDTSSVEIIVAEGSYGYNELLRVQEAIMQAYMSDGESGRIVSVGTGLALIDGEVVGFGESGKELRVVVGVAAEYAEEYRDLFRKEYGDMVYVEVSESAVLTNDAVLEQTKPIQPAAYLLGGAALAIAAAAAVIWMRQKKNRT